MARAEVGDDVLEGDPTTRRLEETVARILGKDRALFFPSGIMANQTALALHGGWGGEVLVADDAHVLDYEDAAAAALAGVQLRGVPMPAGVPDLEVLEARAHPSDPVHPRTRAVALECPHLASGGRIVSPDVVARVGSWARERGLAVHLDGARLWHAAAESGSEPTAWTREVTTVMVSLSKGLGCPVGSVLAGPAELMEEAWRVRRRLGGAMRQSGILAAAGLHALEHHRDGLRDDHERARRLARAFDQVPGLRADSPETNVVLVEVASGGPDLTKLLSFLGKHRILMLDFGNSRLRAVTHRDVDSPGIARVVHALAAWREA
jgi:threonine aldolase